MAVLRGLIIIVERNASAIVNNGAVSTDVPAQSGWFIGPQLLFRLRGIKSMAGKNAEVKVVPVGAKGGPALGIEASWVDSQFVMIIADKGFVACGVIDVAVMEKVGAAVAVARGTPERQLVVVDDLLNAKIQDMTKNAGSLGVKVGMTGREALDILSF